MNITKNIKEGDIFYVEINRKYFFMQVIHITENLPPPYDIDYKFGYFIVVFEKSFTKLPQSLSELDLKTIYRIKYKPTKSILYVSHWDTLPEIKVKKGLTNWERHTKYKLQLFDNSPISESFIPEIVRDFTMPSKWKINDEGIHISHSPDEINWIYSRIEQDEQKRMEVKKNIQAIYFKQWIDDVEPEAIIKTEKAITTFNADLKTKDLRKALKKCVLAINKLDEKLSFITTIEAEDIHDKLIEIAIKNGLSEQDAFEVIEQNRDW
jgi:hypothetical protein